MGKSGGKQGDWLDRLFPGSKALLTEEGAQRYEQLLFKLRRQLEQETNKYRMVQQAYEEQGHDEPSEDLRAVLAKCIDDVKQDIASRNQKKRSALRRGNRTVGGTGRFSTEAGAIDLDEFSPSDRINVIEWLLSQDRIIYMLYDLLHPRIAQAGQF
jgi:hypothetical protein